MTIVNLKTTGFECYCSSPGAPTYVMLITWTMVFIFLKFMCRPMLNWKLMDIMYCIFQSHKLWTFKTPGLQINNTSKICIEKIQSTCSCHKVCECYSVTLRTVFLVLKGIRKMPGRAVDLSYLLEKVVGDDVSL